jgi:hypothetical protein
MRMISRRTTTARGRHSTLRPTTMIGCAAEAFPRSRSWRPPSSAMAAVAHSSPEGLCTGESDGVAQIGRGERVHKFGAWQRMTPGGR